jgi:hypothetical protein
MAATKKSKRNIEDDYSRTIARFMEKVAIQHGGGCWEWLAGKDKDGYGSFQYGGPRGEQKFEKRRAHRVSFDLFCGGLPEGMLVCHRCDNPSCVNPDHLFLGSTKDNVRDRINKGRSAAGESHGRHSSPESFRRGAAKRRRMFDFRGRSMSLHEISAETGIPLVSLRSRIGRGWSIERAVSVPPFHRGQNLPGASVDVVIMRAEVAR